ncbi:FMN-binding negative transcriptional regulator [Patiriisocius hiemis]|uniref:FMN-binding negative transcriptional regulator n=1 Tax=Patiriisocius hiemis TaxID=3075604 RepID=A0ABU2YFD8_9FLAO|nr:FMN-binding negative transcriptional regulator [Constantimarinum sp. W242]MDT0556897.1 FMN-binding negative transcriptional regulator [Constantimarinum sp. W242]
MYPPPHHQSQDKTKMIALIKQFPFATLITAINNTPFVTHIPVIYNEVSKKLVAHIDKNNPQIETLKNGSSATLVFKGPDTYISPSIYTTKQLPTWNYMIVHVQGNITQINAPEAVKETMVAMTAFLEGQHPNFTLKMDDNRMDRLINYIQAFEVTPTHWEAKFKLSQDKNPADFEAAKQELIKKSNKNIAGFIEGIYT